MVQIKICGIRRAEEIAAAVEAGANLLGFNFWPHTPRYVPPEEAARMIRAVPEEIWTVGVFVDEAPERVLEIAAQTGVSALQFHGSETPEYLDRVSPYKKIKAFKVTSHFEPEQLRPFGSAYAFLLDGWLPGGLPGGTGSVFDWSQAVRAKEFGRIVLAGGLNARNVAEAIRQVRPWAVDVCSGVEIEPGKKDLKRIPEFVRAVREAEAQIASTDLDDTGVIGGKRPSPERIA